MKPKKWWTSKTFWLGVLICAGGIAEFIAGLPVSVSIPTIIAGALAIIVRFLTKNPII